jgi:hypothetical protein
VLVEQRIYRQPNGKYAVCFMLDGKPTFRTVGYEFDAARQERRAFVEAARWGVVASAPRLRFGQVAGWWVERFARHVAAGERCERTLEFRRYHLERHLLPAFGSRLLREITIDDIAEQLALLREQGRAENTIAGALATLQCVLRFAVRNGWTASRSSSMSLKQSAASRTEVGPLQAATAGPLQTAIPSCTSFSLSMVGFLT